MDLKDLLLEHHSSLERKEKRRIPLKKLAAMIGIDETYFNHVYNMRRTPNEKIVDQFYDFFGDLRFYDVTGLERPDPLLKFIAKRWKDLSPTQKEKIAKTVDYGPK